MCWQQSIFQVEKFSPQKSPVTMSVRINFVGNMNLGQKSCLNSDKFGIDNDISEWWLAPFA